MQITQTENGGKTENGDRFISYAPLTISADQEKIQWMFDCEKARQKMLGAYAQLKPQADVLPLPPEPVKSLCRGTRSETR